MVFISFFSKEEGEGCFELKTELGSTQQAFLRASNRYTGRAVQDILQCSLFDTALLVTHEETLYPKQDIHYFAYVSILFLKIEDARACCLVPKNVKQPVS